MTICEREELVLDLLRDGRDLTHTELGPHVASCASCADLVAVAGAILDDHHEVVHADSPVPTSGVMWWRMQRRMRQESVRKAERTVTAAQVISVAAAIVVAVAIVGIKTLASSISLDAISMPTVETLMQWSFPLAIVLTVCLALAPVALYLSLARD